MKLLVTAQDGGGVMSVKPAEVTINVLHSARAPAVFHKSRYTFTVPEDAMPGTTVGTVEAVTPAGEGLQKCVCVCVCVHVFMKQGVTGNWLHLLS